MVFIAFVLASIFSFIVFHFRPDWPAAVLTSVVTPSFFRIAGMFKFVTNSDTSVTCLQVILTPTGRVSGYPRQVIKVDAA
jgi:hypothetical protein